MLQQTPLLLSLLALLAPLAPTATADCECGFTDENGRVWQYGMMVPFKSVRDLNALPDIKVDTRRVEANTNVSGRVVRIEKEGEKGRDSTEWRGDPISDALPQQFAKENAFVDSAGNLNLVVKGSPTRPKEVSTGQIITSRSDIRYGTFRSNMQIPSTPGVCSGFFFYKNDDAEIDFEIVSSNASLGVAYSVIHPQIYQHGGDLTNDTFRQLSVAPTDLTKGFNTFRFDWLPGKVQYYLNDQPLTTMTVNVPDVGGSMFVNNWSNGNANWSGAPPTTDVALLISKIAYFFNSSDTSLKPDPRCANATAQPTLMCNIKDLDAKNQYVPMEGNGAGVLRVGVWASLGLAVVGALAGSL
ncbi:hypothetical protein HK104_004040 [Borealophlyctis nickersoniae]|nr:hypothetical protein HK104_004040 [Borealophlyctis nickersoniae]